MAIDRGTTVVFERGGPWVELASATEDEPAVVVLDDLDTHHPSEFQPFWARYVAGVAATIRPVEGGQGVVTTELPVGAGLSSSAALEVAVALALGFEGSPRTLAQACQQAEHLASGVPCGIMDQLASVLGRRGHALLIDCTTLDVVATPVPDDFEVIVVHSGERRELATSAYGVRRAQVEEAAAVIGRPLRDATLDDLSAVPDGALRRRIRHVLTENERVREFAAALAAGDGPSAGALMTASHASLRDDFEVSTPVLDGLVDKLTATSGVYGARLTGAGFGGCVVALAAAGTSLPDAWVVHPADGASLQSL
jgi:galactokinase